MLKFLKKNGYISDICIITVLWIVAIVIVNPAGDFPLGDDWSYGKTVKLFIEKKVYQPTDFTSMTFFTHFLWGALVCSVFGFSFNVLRFSMLLISFSGICATYLFIRQLSGGRSLALISALTLAFNPVYFALSYIPHPYTIYK